MITKTIPEKFKQCATELRQLALDHLRDIEWRKTQLTKPETLMFIDKLESTGIPYEIINQVKRDLHTYNHWDCIGFWMDVDFGLVCFAPEVMVSFVKEIVEVLERKYHNET